MNGSGSSSFHCGSNAGSNIGAISSASCCGGCCGAGSSNGGGEGDGHSNASCCCGGSSAGHSSSSGSSGGGISRQASNASASPWWTESGQDARSGCCAAAAVAAAVECSLTLTESSSDAQQASSSNRKYCCVCGDLASGYHYGVSSCEACKAFFKRTVQGNVNYSCLASNGCQMTKDKRKTCQACRLRKCLTVGMMREGVRPDRTKGGRQRYRSRSGSVTDASMFRTGAEAVTSRRHSIAAVETVAVAAAAAASIAASPAVAPAAAVADTDGPTLAIDSFGLSADEELLQCLLSAEPPQLVASMEEHLDRQSGLISRELVLADIADSELLHTIWWARQVPGFEGLSLATQMNLLVSNWLAVLGLQLAYRSAPFAGASLAFSCNFILPMDDVKQFFPYHEHYLSVAKLSQKLAYHQVSKGEYVLLKALVLLTADEVSDAANVEREVGEPRDRIYDALFRFCTRDYGAAGASHRAGDLLGCLHQCGAIGWSGRQFWSQMRLSGRVEMHQLFLEMLQPSDVGRRSEQQQQLLLSAPIQSGPTLLTRH